MPRSATRAHRPLGADPGVLTLLVVLIVGLWAALSIDIVRTGFGVKGDEATYVAMALSVAHDRDLAFERRDLERFLRAYQAGPEGIFLKRGRAVHVAWRSSWPFLYLDGAPEERTDRLYFGKAYAFAVAAAPFVWMAGLNGFLVFHVLLLVGVLAAGYAFLAARSPAPASLLFATAFVGASIAPIYLVWLTPEIFNFSLVFFAFFFWLHKEVAAGSVGCRWLTGTRSDWLAVALLGVATFSKPLNVLLIVPIVFWHWWRRRWRDGFMAGLVFGLVVVACFGVNAAISGELNYQGGARKTFYGRFPFDQADATFDNRGVPVTTEDLDPEGLLGRDAGLTRFLYNFEYFFVGRNFGLVPFFFPGVVALVGGFARRGHRRPWHGLTLAATALTALALLVFWPYTWSGGGGALGNRYFLSVYPALFFLAPPLRSVAPGLIAWAGGALFTAHILVNPFVASDQPWRNTQQGALRLLPVELTVAYDLPAMLSASRCRIRYGPNNEFQLCYLDENAFPPERDGRLWIAGQARAEIIVRSAEPIRQLSVTLRAPIVNSVRVASGSSADVVPLRPGVPSAVTLEPFGLHARYAYAYLLSIETEQGFVPRLMESESRDSRFLGAQIQISRQ